jgi:hypothetical protein
MEEARDSVEVLIMRRVEGEDRSGRHLKTPIPGDERTGELRVL